MEETWRILRALLGHPPGGRAGCGRFVGPADAEELVSPSWRLPWSRANL